APLAKIFAVRVFGVNASAGAPTSRILQAIETVINLRQRYNTGQPGGLKVDVCNLSLGITTLFAGRDILDQAVEALLANRIIPVVSGGNSGPAPLTVSSPATSLGGITVGAVSFAANERIQREL